jgi:hypothetical protein
MNSSFLKTCVDILMASDRTGIGPCCPHQTGDIVTFLLKQGQPQLYFYIYNQEERAEINYTANNI